MPSKADLAPSITAFGYILGSLHRHKKNFAAANLRIFLRTAAARSAVLPLMTAALTPSPAQDTPRIGHNPEVHPV